MAASLIDLMTEDFDPEKYKDNYREARFAGSVSISRCRKVVPLIDTTLYISSAP